MNSAADFEGKKAHEWDQDTVIEDTAASALRTPPSGARRGIVPFLPRGIPRTAPSPQFLSSPRPISGKHRYTSRTGQSEEGSRRHPSTPADAKISERLFPSSKAAVRVGPHRINPSTGWASAPDLEKNRYKNTVEDVARQREEASRYLGQPDAAAEYPGTGIYIWPERSQDMHPREAFGRSLEDLDVIRRTYNVYIYWEDNKKWLEVKSPSLMNAEHDVGAAIIGLRQAYRHAKAQNSLANPLFIVVPPSPAMMRAKVSVKSVKERPGETTLITELELSGEPYTEVEKKHWNQEREKAYQEDFIRIKKHLVNNIFRLAPLLEWMRMRVHFGHVNLSMYKDDFMEEGHSFSRFVAMMKDKRTITGSIFDKKMNAKVAKNMINLIKDSNKFKPGQARVFTLDDIQSKDTLVVFVKTESGMLRLEAAIDHSNIEIQEDNSHKNYVGQYQMGSTTLYETGRRNKRTELTAIDIEKEVDWNLDIITDSSVKTIPSTLVDMVVGSITGSTVTKRDELGFPYPDIKILPSYDIHIAEIVVRSVYEYGIKNTDYIVEIAIYRSWTIAQWNLKVRPEPRVETGVTMYHQSWDWNMIDVKANPSIRNWNRDLSDFFPPTVEDDDSTNKIDPMEAESRGGLEGFLHAARYVKEMLQEANRDSSGENTLSPII